MSAGNNNGKKVFEIKPNVKALNIYKDLALIKPTPNHRVSLPYARRTTENPDPYQK